eukprot:934167-Pleurochrysis_carterae.AAC.6
MVASLGRSTSPCKAKARIHESDSAEQEPDQIDEGLRLTSRQHLSRLADSIEVISAIVREYTNLPAIGVASRLQAVGEWHDMAAP